MKFLMIVALLCCGCSQTTVHLYSRYLSAGQVEKISQELEAADFIVKSNQLKFPKSVMQSSLTYSPMIEDRNAVNKTLESMSGIGWDIHHTSMLFIDNHWYKENSIALLLLPPDINPHIQTSYQNWANEYSSQDCELELKIMLNINGQYQIFNSTKQLVKEDFSEGIWKISEFPFLELRSKESHWALYFELKQYSVTDLIGEIHISELSPMSNYLIFAGCIFVHGLRL